MNNNPVIPCTVIDARGRVWPAEGANLARMWNRCKPRRSNDWYRRLMIELRYKVRHTIAQNVNDYAPRGPSRNRAGTNNRRMRKHLATQPRVIFSTPFFDIVAD